jgi:hypothetical protein
MKKAKKSGQSGFTTYSRTHIAKKKEGFNHRLGNWHWKSDCL